MTTRVVILGAGFGGLELATLVSAACGDEAQVTLVDKAEGFAFGFSKLDVMFGRLRPDRALHRYADLARPGVRFVPATVTAIDPTSRRVRTDAGAFGADTLDAGILDADILVVALGADLHPEATPGLVEGGHEFYTVAGAFALRDVLDRFAGGRVIVGVTSTPFKCPPAPSETALLLHEFLGDRGLLDRSDISLVMPLGTPIPPSPQASAAVLAAFADRGIHWHPERLVRGLDPDHVYAVGDVTSVGTPKAGVFAEGQAAVVAARVIDTIRGSEPLAGYDGRGTCYLEFGHREVAKVDVTFRAGQRPVGDLDGPSTALAEDKTAFGTDRISRWFGRAWTSAV